MTLKNYLRPFMLLSLALPLCAQSNVVNVTSFGAVGNGSNPTNNLNAFRSAFANAGSEGTVIVPPGTYAFDNSAGPLTINGFDGEFQFQGNSRIMFSTSSNSGFVFNNGWGTTLTAFHSIYSASPSSGVSGSSVLTFNGTVNLRMTDTIIQGSPGAGISIINALEPKLSGVTVYSSFGAAVKFSNSRNPEVSDATLFGSGDGLVFHTDSGVSGRDGGHASNIAILSGTRGIVVEGSANVTVTDFRVNGTSSNALFCGQAGTSGQASNSSFLGGLISGPNGVGIEINNPQSCNFSDISMYNGTGRGVDANAPSGMISMQGVHIIGNPGGDAFNFTNASEVTLADCAAENIGGYGFYLGGVARALVSGLSAISTSQGSSLHRAIWFENGTALTANTLMIVDNNSPATGYVVGTSNIQKGNIQNVSSVINGALSVQTQPSVTVSQVH